jgi:hypothetical protein
MCEDDRGNQFKVIFGCFENEEEAENFSANAMLAWANGKFYVQMYGENSRCFLNNEDITYANGDDIENIAQMYPDILKNDIWHRHQCLRIVDAIILKKSYRLDIEEAYIELWRVIFNILDNLGEAIYYNGELETMGSALDNAFRIWKKAGELMKGQSFESSQVHNDRLIKTYDLLNTIFKGLDTQEALRTVKYGQSSRYAMLFKDNQNSLVNGSYVFNK